MENKKLTADVLATKLAQVIHQMGKDECHLSKLIKYFPLDKYYVNGYMDDDLMNALIEVFDKEGIMLINDVNGSQTIFFPTKLINEEDSEEIDNGYEDKDLEKLAGIKTNDEYDEVIPCKLCGDMNPTYEMVKEKDLGWICDSCARTLESRGEELDFEESDYEWENKQWEVDGFSYDSEEEARNAFEQAIDTEPSSDHVLMYGDEEIQFYNGL